MNFFYKPLYPVMVIWILACTSCGLLGNKNKFEKVPGYNIHDPVTVKLKTELDEISGIVYYPKDTSVFAINDEQGVLYKIYLRDEIKIEEWKFSDDADYEDLALVDSTFYALHSNGNITRFKIFSPDSIIQDELELPLKGKNEFESMYFDSVANQLVLLCKDCKGDKKEVNAYAFNLAQNSFLASPIYSLDGNKVLGKLNSAEKKFKPSAAAIHPVSGDVYIISSVNKCLVIAGRNGEVKEVYAIDPGLFKQPEGITFTPNGDLFISNEFAEIGAGNILIFKSKQKH